MTSEPTTSQTPAVRAGRRRRRQLPLWAHLVLALLLVALLRNFVGQSFYVPSSSMVPTLEVGDRVVVSKLSDDVERGDVVVFDGTDTFGGGSDSELTGTFGSILTGVGRFFAINPGEKDYVKRIVGVGGDRIVCCDADGRITVNGVALAEDYLPDGVDPSLSDFDVEVPAGRLFMLGDNRDNSADSRAHLGSPGGGMIPVEDVIGKPAVRFWPLDRLGGVEDKGSAELAQIPRAGS